MDNAAGINKSPSGIDGLDDITLGGLPSGRPTLVCGSAGCGKTLLATTFLVHGASVHGEPGLFVSFEERPDDIVDNVRSLGFDIESLMAEGRFAFEHISINPAELAEIGDYDLEGLFIRLELAIDQIGAKRVVLDTIESLFSAFSNPAVLRAEVRRLFDWLKDRGLTTIITGERGDGTLTRQGLEEYVSDCVILLDHRVHNQASTRRLRIVKYRGTAHGTNEYPFLIDEKGFSVLPVSMLGLDHAVSDGRIPSGIPDLDAMIEGGGFYRGTSILISGVAGSGKSSIAAHFVDAACKRGERALYFSFEESAAQTVRNMRSVGLSLGRWIDQGLLEYQSARPTFHGLEMHLAVMLREIAETKPQVVVLDPISSFTSLGEAREVEAMLLRIVDYLKSHGITGIFTNLTQGNLEMAQTDVGLSSLMDAWLLLLNRESIGEYNRELYILKARGVGHSNQVREFLMSADGLQLRQPYIGQGGALTGSARLVQEAQDRIREAERLGQLARRKREVDSRCRQLAAQLDTMQSDLEAERLEFERLDEEESALQRQRLHDVSDLTSRRRGSFHAKGGGAE